MSAPRKFRLTPELQRIINAAEKGHPRICVRDEAQAVVDAEATPTQKRAYRDLLRAISGRRRAGKL